MIVGHDQELIIRLSYDDAGACGFSLLRKSLPVESLNFLREVVVHRYDRRHYLVHHFGDLCIRRGRIGDHKTSFILRDGCIRIRCVLRRLCLCRFFLRGLFLRRLCLFRLSLVVCFGLRLLRHLLLILFTVHRGVFVLTRICDDRVGGGTAVSEIVVHAPCAGSDTYAENDRKNHRQESFAPASGGSAGAAAGPAAYR